MSSVYLRLSQLLLATAFAVVVLGAYVRLSDAGLGCPDWPGCYGHLVVPQNEAAVSNQAHLAARPLVQGKAWREMIHRYLASSLGFLILLLGLLAWRRRHENHQPLAVPLLLLPLVAFQGALGMWTVTLLLKPLVVTAHLLGGITVLALLTWNLCAVVFPRVSTTGGPSPGWVGAALVVLGIQLFLGGWTSTNYAALACTDFPTCHGTFWPKMDFGQAFVLWRGLGINYEFGVLDTPARTAIHVAHRMWAMVAAGTVGLVALWSLRGNSPLVRRIGGTVLLLLFAQVGLGITNVLRGLPLPVAVMHNGGAALLTVSLVALLYCVTRPATINAS